MNTGENQEGLKKILDFTRMGSLVMMGIHTYVVCYSFFIQSVGCIPRLIFCFSRFKRQEFLIRSDMPEPWLWP